MRSPRIPRCLALSLLLAGATPGLARATPPEAAKPPAEAAKPPAEAPAGADEQAARWLGAGNKAFKEGKFAEAEHAYREAFAVKKGYDIAGNLGAAELSQGKLREGAAHLSYTLRMFPVTGDPAVREQMNRAYQQCRAGVGAVRVEVEPRGATVLVDGVPAGEAPLLDEVFVDAGEHVFEARLDGYTGAPRRVTVEKGGAVEVALPLTPLPPKVEVVPVIPRRRSVIPGLGLGSIAVVGLVGGAAFMSMSASKRSDLKVLGAQILGDHQSCVPGATNYDVRRCATVQSTLRADDAFREVAIGAFIAGSAAAAATAAYFLWPSRASASTGQQIRVTPVVGAGDGAVLLSGSF